MNKNFYNNQSKSEEEFDFILIYNFFFRNKLIISACTLIFFLFFCIFTLFKKQVWEGNFEIVIENNKSTSSINNSLLSAGISNLDMFDLSSGGKSSFNTEVAILESPSVLMPVFEYVNQIRKKKLPEITFKNWKKNIQFERKSKTSILDISYKDTQKSLIIPVLEKISSTYQSYSGRSKKRQIELSQNYLNDQIKVYQFKSSESLKNAQEFAIEQDLSMLDLNLNNIKINQRSTADLSGNLNRLSRSDIGNSQKLVTNTEIESIRVKAANEIKTIDLQIKQIEGMKDSSDSESIAYIVSALPIFEGSLSKQLKDFDLLLLEAKSKYTGKDTFTIQLEQKRNELIKLLKKRTVGYLKMRRLAMQARMESATRPKGVILKYKKLVREASRDENTLIALEDQLRRVNLEKARLEDPWELITKPTLTVKPIAPNKKLYGLIGLIFGFSLSVVYSLYKERKSGFIIEKKYLENILGLNISDKLNTSSQKFLNYKNEVLFNEIIQINEKKEFKFITIGNIGPEKINILKKLINIFVNEKKNLKSNIDLLFEDDLSNIDQNTKIVLICSLESLTYKEVANFKNRLFAINKDLYACLLIE